MMRPCLSRRLGLTKRGDKETEQRGASRVAVFDRLSQTDDRLKIGATENTTGGRNFASVVGGSPTIKLEFFPLIFSWPSDPVPGGAKVRKLYMGKEAMEADTKTLHSFTSAPIPKTTSPQAMHVVDDTKMKSTSGDEESVVNGSKSTQCHNLEGDARKEEVSKGVDKGKGIRGDNSVESDMGRKDCDRVEKVVLGTPVHLKDADPCNHTLHEDLCHLRSAYISACHDEEINARQRAKLDTPDDVVDRFPNGWPNEWINRYSPLQNSPLPVLD
ncbi:hypothetical protein L6452_25945 [Arctium lappa]|uniref:Uncharacterized protein n=1 Tax=Arctium lappa TaxID=4217 RepID=A0ACB9ACG1_ARCLA|nr:hypothetical protein L6452_25945 [Arctium lappa]